MELEDVDIQGDIKILSISYLFGALAVAGIVLSVDKLILPSVQDSLDTGNHLTLYGLGAVLYYFLSRFFNAVTINKMHNLTPEVKFSASDGFFPIISELKYNQMFNIYTLDDDGDPLAEGLAGFIIKVGPTLNIIFAVLYYAVFIFGGAYVCNKYGSFDLLSQHSFLLFILLIIFFTHMTIKCFVNFSLFTALDDEDLVVTFNPVNSGLGLLVLPVISMLNTTYIFSCYIGGASISVMPILNLLGFIVFPIVTPFITMTKTSKLIEEIKANQLRLEEQ